MRWNFALSRWGDWGVVDFCGCGGRPGEEIGTQGSAREAEGERRRNPWFWSLVLGIISKEFSDLERFSVRMYQFHAKSGKIHV